MQNETGRRDFLKSALALSAACAWNANAAGSQRQTLKVALNAYSFSKLLNNTVKGRGEGVTLIQVLEFAAKNHFEGFDPTGYFFPGYPAVPSDDAIDNLKRRAADLGVGISGTGVRNNFTTADVEVRKAAVKHIREWVQVAARLGAPVLRVFADTQMRNQTWESVAKGYTRDQVQEWIAADLRECADQGKKYGVRIGVQNHGDFLRTGQQLLDLVKAVGSEWCGPIVDTGYFKTPDPYADIALVAPHAVNWQIKQSPFGQDSDIRTDLVRLVKIIRKSGYSGYLPIETLSPKGKDYDPFTVVPNFARELREAIAQTTPG